MLNISGTSLTNLTNWNLTNLNIDKLENTFSSFLQFEQKVESHEVSFCLFFFGFVWQHVLLTFKGAFFWTRFCNVAKVHVHTCAHIWQSPALTYNATSVPTAPNTTFSLFRQTRNVTYLVCEIVLHLLPFRTSQLFLRCCWAATCGPTWVLAKIHAVITGHVWLEEHCTNTSINKTKAIF